MNYGRVYYAVIDAISVSAVCDLYWLSCPTDSIVMLHELEITQDASETSEQLPLMVFRTTTDNSANGTSNTPNPAEVGTAAFGGTCRTNITGASLAAETTLLWRRSQNILNGWHKLWKPNTEPILTPAAATAGRIAVKLDTAPGTAITISGVLTFSEIGG